MLAGEEYALLPDTFVIFICDFDPFGCGFYRYSFESRCRENALLDLKEGCQYIFLNAAGTDPESVPDHLASFTLR